MNKRFILLLVLFLWSVSFRASAHPYHVSIGEVNYNSKTQTLEIALKVFTDDLEKTLSDSEKMPVVLSNAKNAKELITAYLKKSFGVELKSKTLAQIFIGSEVEKDAHWLYLEIPVKQNELSQLSIRNQLLMETFDDQMNILNLNLSSKKQTLLFKNNDFRKAVSR